MCYKHCFQDESEIQPHDSYYEENYPSQNQHKFKKQQESKGGTEVWKCGETRSEMKDNGNNGSGAYRQKEEKLWYHNDGNTF